MTLHESSLRIILRDDFKGGFFMSEKMLVTQALEIFSHLYSIYVSNSNNDSCLLCGKRKNSRERD